MSQPPYPQPQGQNPGSQYPGSQYPVSQYPGYQNAPPPPSGYDVGRGAMAPQPPWGAQPPQQTVARPPTVTYALAALVANMVLGLLSTILIFANKDAYLDEALRDAGLDPSSPAASSVSDAAFTVGAILGLVFVGVWGLFLWFAWKGHNWARIVIWVFGGLSLISAFAAFDSPVGSIIAVTVVQLLLTLTAVVLLALKPSNEWYSYQGNARTYGWPGRA